MSSDRIEKKILVRARTGWEAKDAAALFAALGDETRLLLVSRLGDGEPISITRLTVGARVTRQAITKHLRVMQRAGIVRTARRGRERLWQLEKRRVQEAHRYLALISQQWDDALARLRRMLEGDRR